ncbi:protein of unknown function [Methanoculleus bourgensis]|uniref:Uncharacterized protein n=1 Tax=Methanoculleus bourgensis TaxID=83986 RepID=A0A0X3BMX6_9EURY|nr:protein of unknown function [Methanoculleus bourgensis]
MSDWQQWWPDRYQDIRLRRETRRCVV